MFVISVSGGRRYCLTRAPKKNLATPLIYSSSKKHSQQQPNTITS
jgi:hypothetical protein